MHGCTIEDEVLIGMGAIILNGAHIGSIVSLVLVVLCLKYGDSTKSVVVGVPAKIIKRLQNLRFLTFFQMQIII